MKTDPLHDLLCRADGAAPPPVITSALASRVLRTARRRALRRTALATLAAMVACGTAISLSRRSHPDPTHDRLRPARLAEIRVELAHLDSEAQRHLRWVAELQQRQLRAPRPGISVDDPTQPDVLDRVDQARNRTALILLREADRAVGDPATRTQANDLYARAAHLFPDTPAGRIAAQRLKRPAIST
jgi:hypothetical protein